MPTLNTSIFNPHLYSRVRSFWFANMPETARTAPREAMQRWFGFGLSDADRAAFDAQCRAEFGSALAAIGPAVYPLPRPSDANPSDASADAAWAAEAAHDAALAAPFLQTLRADAAPDAEARNALGLVLLLDQMPRNIFREAPDDVATADAAASPAVIYQHYDVLARAVTRRILASTPRLDLADAAVRASFVRRQWLYLPLMHSEHARDHEQYAAVAGEALREAEAEVAADQGGVEAEENAELIRQGLEFGRKHQAIIDRFGRYPYRNHYLGRQTTEAENEYLEGGGDTFGVKTQKKK